MWILTLEVNDYDQYGQYFVAWYSKKPSAAFLQETFNLSLEESMAVFDGQKESSKPKSHQTWYTLAEYKEGEVCDANLQELKGINDDILDSFSFCMKCNAIIKGDAREFPRLCGECDEITKVLDNLPMTGREIHGMTGWSFPKVYTKMSRLVKRGVVKSEEFFYDSLGVSFREQRYWRM